MHTIKFVANCTGLSQHTIRAWERRYAVLTPERTTTNRRLYSANDIEKLSLIQAAVRAGHSVGRIAGLTLPELRGLTTSEEHKAEPVSMAIAIVACSKLPVGAYLQQCQDAVDSLDSQALEEALTRAVALFGAAALIDRVVQPLLENIGERWRQGEVRPANEHMASAIVRTFLGRMLDGFQPSQLAPRLIVTTPAGQVHELGALVAAVTAASQGWRVLYLGPNLPAEEIAGAAHQAGASVVALSISYPPDDTRLDQEVAALRKYVGPEVTIVAGGRAAPSYRLALDSVRAIYVSDMNVFRSELEALRTR